MNRNALPQSAAGNACGYTLTLWKRLTCFLNHRELDLSNNLAENSMRPVATGQENWIHIGSQQAGPRIGRDPLRHRKLPTHEDPGARLPRRHPASASPNLLLPPGQPTAGNFQPRGWNRPYSSSQPCTAESMWLHIRIR
ncbi:MAG: IS66 family transposase [Acidobacteriaceae bacterium]